MVKYVKTINRVIDELSKVIDFYNKRKKLGKRELNKLTKCMEILEAFKIVVVKDITPKPPKTLEDAIAWLQRKKQDGTYIAILDTDGHLIRTTLAAKEQIIEPLLVQLATTPITLQMQKIIMRIPTIGFEKTIPKKATSFIQLVKNGIQIERVGAKKKEG